MTPCYQICKDHQCPYWNPELLDCDRLPDDCDWAVEQLVSDCENQYLDGKKHGLWRDYFENGQVDCEGHFVEGEREGLWRNYFENGQVNYEINYVEGEKEGLWKVWLWEGE